MDKISIYCDGACKGNNTSSSSHGGWGVYSKEMNIELYGGSLDTTNNRMELQAVIEAFTYLLKTRLIDKKNPKLNNEVYTIYSDSNYVIKGINEWIYGWHKKDYKDVKNDDLWRILYKLKLHFKDVVYFEWVKGHSGNIGNEYADKLANRGCDKVKYGSI